MVIHVLDEGEGFDVADVPDPLAEENLLKMSGRGIFLMRAFMDEFEVARGPQGGAEIIMAKRFPDRGTVSPNVATAKRRATRKEKRLLGFKASARESGNITPVRITGKGTRAAGTT